MSVAAMEWEGAQVEAPAVELGPPHLTEIPHAQDVAEEPGGLLAIHTLELALVARNGNTGRVTECSPELW